MADKQTRVIMEVARQGLFTLWATSLVKSIQDLKVQSTPIFCNMPFSILFILGPPPGAVYQFIVAYAAYPVYVFYFLMALAVLILRKT